MKNKLHISESEMKRILSLHKERIDQERKIIKERNGEIEEDTDQGQSTGRIMAGSASGAALGAGIGALLTIPAGGVGAAPGSVIGAGVGALVGWATTSGGYYNRVKKLFQFCRNHRSEIGKPVNTIPQIRDIADNLRAAFQGWGSTDEMAIARNLRKLKTIPDLCKLSAIYNERFGTTLMDDLDGDIDQDDQWKDFVWIPMSELSKNTKKIDNTQVKKAAKKCGWGDDIEGYKNSGWRCPKTKKSDNSKLKENAKKCGWGDDIQGYKNSGWRCPKNKKVTPNPTPNPTPITGTGGMDDNIDLDWSATDVSTTPTSTKIDNSTFDELTNN
jgi:hypothetical protein